MADARPIRTTHYFLIGWILIGTVFGGLFAWSVFAPFEGAVMAAGVVGVESRHQAVQHLEGGIVAEMLVTEGSLVKEGDLLIRLDGTAIEAQLASVDARLTDLAAREARLKAERDDAAAFTLREGIDGLLDPVALADTLTSQRTLREARASSRTTQISILSQRIEQLERQIDGLRSEVAAKRQQSVLIADELAGLEELLDKGLTPKPRLLALERERSQLDGDTESLSADIARTQVQIGEARLEKLRLTDGFREEVIKELTEVQTQLAALLQERKAAADKLKRLEIRAPRSGRVLAMRTYTIGGVIAPGEPIMQIVPADDRLIAAVRIAPSDIDKITVGQTAMLRFTAFSQRITPTVDGTVLKVSADAVRDETSGQAYYEVIVELPEQQPLGEQFAIVPGMPVEAMMRTESRNALSYLTKPLRDSVARTFRE